jgi:hypothetical protein
VSKEEIEALGNFIRISWIAPCAALAYSSDVQPLQFDISSNLFIPPNSGFCRGPANYI